MDERYRLNELQPCGTKAARITHLAHGEQCDTCRTDRLADAPNRGSEEEVSR